MKDIFSFLVLALFCSSYSLANVMRRLEVCEKEINLMEVKPVAEYQVLSQLPKGLFLVREIQHTVSDEGQIKYHTRKSMIGRNDQNSESCFFGDPQNQYKTAGLVPVLIDLTDKKEIGDSFWNFSYSFDKRVGSLNTNRSLMPNEDYQKKLIGQGFELEKVQISHDEFELRLNRSHQKFSEKIVLIFDRK